MNSNNDAALDTQDSVGGDDDWEFQHSDLISEQCLALLGNEVRDLRAVVLTLYRYCQTFNLEISGLEPLCGEDAADCIMCTFWSESFVGYAIQRTHRYLTYLLEDEVEISASPEQPALVLRVRMWATAAQELPQDGSHVAIPDPGHYGI